jgi:hypothetical protein
MKAIGIRKLRVDTGWRQFTEPELSSLMQPSAALSSLQRVGQKISAAPTSQTQDARFCDQPVPFSSIVINPEP